jgi:hydroxyacylglutathione hydrolase
MNVKINRIPLGITNCYLVQGEAAVLVDCGDVGNGKRFTKALAALGIKPSEVNLIVLTHAHADHVGSAAEIQHLTGAKVAMHAAEAPYLSKGMASPAKPATRWARILFSLLSSGLASSINRVPAYPPDIVITEDHFPLESFGIPARVVFTPGHTPGSISVVLDQGDALVGDLAMSGFPSLSGRPDLPIIADDLEQVRASWRKLMDAGVKTFSPAHGKPFPAAVLLKLL